MRNFRKNIKPYIWIAPSILMFLVFLFYPMVFNVSLSFFDWNGLNPKIFGNFVFLNNFINLFKDKIFLKSLYNSLILVFFTVTLQNIIALFASIFLFQGKFKASAFLRGVIFFPAVLSGVVISLLWRPIFLQGGFLNKIITFLGGSEIYLLSSPKLAFMVIIFLSIWQWFGFNMIIFYAGLQSLDLSLLEAASIDGAGFWNTITKIIIPNLKPAILINVILNLFGGFQIFDIVFVMTKGGPIHSTEVLTTNLVRIAFKAGMSKFGYAASIATFMMIIMLIFAYIRLVVSKKLEK
jgi:ABC-type sugar transport system permease subunit